jgi:hypothetical protein
MTANLTLYYFFTGLVFGVKIFTLNQVIIRHIPLTCSGIIYAFRHTCAIITALARVTVANYTVALAIAGLAICRVTV